MSLTPFQRGVLEHIGRGKGMPKNVRYFVARRASINAMVRDKWIEKKWTRQVSGAWTAEYVLTDLGLSKLELGKT